MVFPRVFLGGFPRSSTLPSFGNKNTPKAPETRGQAREQQRIRMADGNPGAYVILGALLLSEQPEREKVIDLLDKRGYTGAKIAQLANIYGNGCYDSPAKLITLVLNRKRFEKVSQKLKVEAPKLAQPTQLSLML